MKEIKGYVWRGIRPKALTIEEQIEEVVQRGKNVRKKIIRSKRHALARRKRR